MRRFGRISLVVGLAAAAAMVGGVGWWKYAPRRTPEGQPALVRLDASSLHEFRAAFNARAHEDRVLVMLSPT
jgi:hypothetical protein